MKIGFTSLDSSFPPETAGVGGKKLQVHTVFGIPLECLTISQLAADYLFHRRLDLLRFAASGRRTRPKPKQVNEYHDYDD